jgi:hypothetical protein
VNLSHLLRRIARSRTAPKTLLFAFSIFAVFAIWTRLNFPPQYDEIAHQAFAQEIAKHPGWSTLIDYEGAGNYEAKGRCFCAARRLWPLVRLCSANTSDSDHSVCPVINGYFAKLAEQLGHGASAISLICLPYL